MDGRILQAAVSISAGAPQPRSLYRLGQATRSSVRSIVSDGHIC